MAELVRRGGLKIRRGKPRAGSSPAPGTTRMRAARAMLAVLPARQVGSKAVVPWNVPAIQGGRDAQLPPYPAFLDGALHAHLLGRDARVPGGRRPGAVPHLGPTH